LELNLKLDYPTDRGHFKGPIIDSKLKRTILTYGPCRPLIQFPYRIIHGNNRKFSVDYYNMKTKTGVLIPRLWLCYSVKLDKVYCETCWLFVDYNHRNFKSEWVEGIDDWQHLSQKIISHEISGPHLDAMQLRLVWTNNCTIDKELEVQISNEAKYWRDVLGRIIKIILSLTAGNLALRGNETKQFCEGNFLRTVKLFAEFDPLLRTVLDKKDGQIKYLSPAIQNELIEILSCNLRKIICDEIKISTFFSIIVDSTQDITKLDQVSIIIRYVTIDYIKHTVCIKESFLGFYAIDHHGAKDYTNLIINVLSQLGLDISKCRGQGYDGAAVMSGIYSGVQKRIQDIVPNAHFVHCCAHNLNLVICDSAKSSDTVRRFFITVQAVFNFFSSSAPRWALLALGEENTLKVHKTVLKKVCATRWEARHQAIFALKERFNDVLITLTKITLTTTNGDERNVSKSIRSKLDSVEFVLLLCL
ncbi:zinc finger MYM-type protein 1-like, partial [Rhopalosiphum padi]|uniref:zinc finger MYM-type protein 1-like n=1 Tax=Rhopalosiphum padi TaxID=40932 RepID=UPI00298EB1E6